GVERDRPENSAARDQAVDALGARPLEVVPPLMRTEIKAENAPDLGQRIGIEEVRYDGEAVLLDAPDVRFQIEARHATVMAAAQGEFNRPVPRGRVRVVVCGWILRDGRNFTSRPAYGEFPS